MQFDQRLLSDGINALLELLLEISRNRADQRTFQTIQKLVTFKNGWEAMQVSTEAQMQQLLSQILHTILELSLIHI